MVSHLLNRLRDKKYVDFLFTTTSLYCSSNLKKKLSKVAFSVCCEPFICTYFLLHCPCRNLKIQGVNNKKL